MCIRKVARMLYSARQCGGGTLLVDGGISMIVKSDIDACKRGLEEHIGHRIRLTSNGGRKRMIIHEGILDHCYPNVFTVRCTRPANSTSQEIISYSYVDILTKVVRVATVTIDASADAV